jgi:GT2 family glycosyltransferase
MSANIWIVVLTYNGLEDTRKCLRSIAACGATVKTVVVDNASSDCTVEAIRAEFPWAHLVVNDANFGFTGGNNRGIEYALERGAGWVVMLNNDTTVTPDFGERLSLAAAANADFGIIGPIVNYMDEPDTVMIDGFIFNAPGYEGFFQHSRLAARRADPPVVREVDVIDGCCMMIAAGVVGRIGLLDDRFFIYHEVVDFCLRARRLGIRSGTLTEQLVWHKGTSSFKKTGKRLPRYYDARNLGLVLWKHRAATHHGRQALGSLLMYLKYIGWRYAVEREDGHLESASAIIEGLCDAIAGRFGAYKPRRRIGARIVRLAFETARRRPRLRRAPAVS